MAAQTQVGLHDDAPGAVKFGAAAEREAAAQRRAGDASGPDHGVAVQPQRGGGRRIFAHFAGHALRVDPGHFAAGANIHTDAGELLARLRRLRRHKVAEHPARALDQHDAGAPRIDAAEFILQRVLCDLAHRAGHLDARRPAADDDKSHPGLALGGVSAALGVFERADHLRADVKSVGQRLQPRRETCPVIVAEIAVRRARGDDQVIEDYVLTVVERDLRSGCVDRRDFSLQDR